MEFGISDHFALRDIRRKLEFLKQASTKVNPFTASKMDVEELRNEVEDLRTTVHVLLDLLISKGLVTVAEMESQADQVIEAIKQKLAAAETPADDNPFQNLKL